MAGTIDSVSSYYSSIASGTSLQSAADDAAGLTIAKEEEAQVNGYDAGTANAEAGKSVLNISDAALGSISDSLQRMRELAVQASSSALMSTDELQTIQDEIDQLKQGISDVASNTEYNTKSLLDGSDSALYIATGANGEGQTVQTGNATLEALGIADFDVTKDFSVKTIDDAIQKVNENRSSIGAQSNSLDYAIGYNTQTSYNLAQTLSEKEDTDYEKAATEKDQEEILQTYQFMMQKKEAEQEQQKLAILYS